MVIRRIIRATDNHLVGGSNKHSSWYLKGKDKKSVYYQRIIPVYITPSWLERDIKSGNLTKRRVSGFKLPVGIEKTKIRKKISKKNIQKQRLVFIK